MFKSLQVVRLVAEKVRNTKGHFVPVGSRVVVVNVKDAEDGTTVVKVRYGKDKTDYRYVMAPVTAFVPSKRGRPLGSGKTVTVVSPNAE